MSDVIDRIVGVAEGSGVDLLRRRRPVTRDHSQGSWQALFEPQDEGTVPLQVRYAVALFAAGVSGDPVTAGFYRQGLERDGGADLAALVDRAVLEGTAAESLRAGLGEPLAAVLDHAHLLVFRPRESSRASLQSLADAGWSPTDVVTLSQLIAFVTYQLKVSAGLRVLNEVVR
jgi:CMD domain protein